MNFQTNDSCMLYNSMAGIRLSHRTAIGLNFGVALLK